MTDTVGTDSGTPGADLGARTLEAIRGRLGASARQLLAGDDDRSEAFALPRGDDGLFGPDSVTWRVHGDLSMLIGGLRALLLQTLHPLAMAGVAQHSDYRNDPWGRLHRTGAFVGATTYGPTAVAEEAIEVVVRVHERVVGVAADGRPYRASDPELITWVHITEVDSFLKAYEHYGPGPLSSADADRYVDEMAIIADRLGGARVPRSREQLRARLADYRPELRMNAQARDATRFLLMPPVPLLAAAPYVLISSAAISLLPGFVRSMMLLPVVPGVDPLIVRPACGALLRTLGWALGPSPTAAAAEERVGGAVDDE